MNAYDELNVGPGVALSVPRGTSRSSVTGTVEWCEAHWSAQCKLFVSDAGDLEVHVARTGMSILPRRLVRYSALREHD